MSDQQNFQDEMKVDNTQRNERFDASSDSARNRLMEEVVTKSSDNQSSSHGDNHRTEQTRTLHHEFKAEYNGDTLERLTIGSPHSDHPSKEITRNPDGSYTMKSGDKETQLKNVKFDPVNKQVTYEDEQGRELTLQKGDTIYKDGRPALTAKGIMAPSRPHSAPHKYIEIPPLESLAK